MFPLQWCVIGIWDKLSHLSLVFCNCPPLHLQGLQGPDFKAEYSGKPYFPFKKTASWPKSCHWHNEVLHVNVRLVKGFWCLTIFFWCLTFYLSFLYSISIVMLLMSQNWKDHSLTLINGRKCTGPKVAVFITCKAFLNADLYLKQQANLFLWCWCTECGRWRGGGSGKIERIKEART